MTEHFEVTGIHEFRQGNELVARYHPGFAYRFTDKNKFFVFNLIDNEMAKQVDAGRLAQLQASNGRVSGQLAVG